MLATKSYLLKGHNNVKEAICSSTHEIERVLVQCNFKQLVNRRDRALISRLKLSGNLDLSASSQVKLSG